MDVTDRQTQEVINSGKMIKKIQGMVGLVAAP